MKILINLLSLPENKLYGVGVFLKNIFINFELNSINASKIIFIYHKNSNIIDLLNLDTSNLLFEFREINITSSRFLRIIYEQFYLPFYAIDFDVVYSPNNVNPIFLSSNVRSIITIHDLLPFKNLSRYGFIQKTYLQIFTKLSIKRAYQIVTVSNTTKKELVNYFHHHENNISVIYNSIDSPKCVDDFLITKNKYFLVISGLNSDKRIDMVITAFYYFQKKYPDINLYIIGGDQGDLNRLMSIVYRFNLSSKVFFLGFVSESLKWSAIKDCIALLMFGRSEGFGIPVLEAMSLGRMSIVSNSGALPEIVGDSGFIVDPESTDQVVEAMESSLLFPLKNTRELESQLKIFSPEVQRKNFWKLIYGSSI